MGIILAENGRTRLDSWKEIAEYIGRDLRTAIRWEKEKGLPVRRVPGGKRQAVFAYRAEIDAWLGNGAGLDSPQAQGAEPSPGNGQQVHDADQAVVSPPPDLALAAEQSFRESPAQPPAHYAVLDVLGGRAMKLVYRAEDVVAPSHEPASDSATIIGLVKRSKRAALGGAAFVIALAGLAWLLLRPAARPPVELTQKRLTFNTAEDPVQSAAISPDGKYLAYSDQDGIHVKLLSTGEERVIPRPPGVSSDGDWDVDSWFPDSTQLLAHTSLPGGHMNMWVASVVGQSPHQMRAGAVGWEVSPDGAHIAFSPEPGPSYAVSEIWLTDGDGENPQRVLALENDSIHHVHWSPDGKRLAYVRVPRTLSWPVSSIEDSIVTCDLNGADRTVVVQSTGHRLDDFRWLPDGRIVYSRTSSPAGDGNLWQIAVTPRRGIPAGNPKLITHLDGSGPRPLSASADGTRMTLLQGSGQVQVYVADLTAEGKRMSAPRRLTNDEAGDAPVAWTPDGKAVVFLSERNGIDSIYRQGIGQEAAEPLVAESEDTSDQAAVSSDGAWILYHTIPKQAPTERRLMRVPVNGGLPQFVMNFRNIRATAAYGCARAPATLCVVLEMTGDEKQLILTAFDPLKGRGKVLRTIERDPAYDDFYRSSKLSPDGSTFAIPRGDGPQISIRLVSLSGGSDRDLIVHGLPNLAHVDWSPDSKGLYCGSDSGQSRTLLYVDLKGNATVLWQLEGGGGVWGVPSPDGRHLAVGVAGVERNVWMLGGF